MQLLFPMSGFVESQVVKEELKFADDGETNPFGLLLMLATFFLPLFPMPVMVEDQMKRFSW